ncbi:MAG: aminoacyl-tRNA hydrolase [Candidatus Obscuribacterales bacterium]|nr:aminoacyl-tRNA hydrolase [Candidatus Obscuribacterales bacterium]
MKLVAGLGNPGSRYEKTRHNVGFCVVDLLGTELGAEFKASSQFNAIFSKTKLRNDDLVLVKPLTFMNLSGQAISAVVRWFKIDFADVLIIHDDVSIPLGKIRMQRGGGAGGQHGIESIIECLGNNSFDRIKVGVGPDPGGERRADYVLSEVEPENAKLLADSLDMTRRAIRTWLTSGPQETANRYNGKNLAVVEVPKPKPVRDLRGGAAKSPVDLIASASDEGSEISD